jgi:small subunit ribosomal protein S5
MTDNFESSGQMDSATVTVERTSTTVKGGRRFSFGALVVVGDRRGKVGFGYGKSNEVPQAVEKAEKYAKRILLTVPMLGSTIPHQVEGKFSSSKVRLIPAAPGTGVVAGGTVRAILEMAGVTDCLTKCYGSTNKRNVVKAVFDGLERLQAAGAIKGNRGLELGSTTIEEKIERGKRFMPTTTLGQGQRKAKGPVNTVGDERRGGRGGGGGGGRGRRRDGDSGGGGQGGTGGPGGPGGAPAAAPKAG